MKLKRILSLLAAAAMAVTAFTGAMSVSAISAADGFATSGTWGIDGNGKWVLSEDGTLTVTGTGEMTGFIDSNFKWSKDINRLVIGEGITKIRQNEFLSCINTTEVILPKTLEGLSGFPILLSMKDIYIYSKNINDITNANASLIPKPGDGRVIHLYKDSNTEKCFKSIYDYTDEDIVYIEGDRPQEPEPVPADVADLTESSGPSGLSSKWEWNETSKTLTFSGTGVISIANDYKKYAKTAEHIIINSGITKINAPIDDTSILVQGRNVNTGFCGFTELKDIELPNTLMEIGLGSFYGTTSLTNIELPSSLIKIGDLAFSTSNITEITFPKSLVEIGECAFTKCLNLKSIKLHEGMTIKGCAFKFCESLEEVVIPKDIVFNPSLFQGAGMARPAETFAQCPKLKIVTIEDGNILKNGFLQVYSQNGIPDNFFQGCSSLETVIIKGDVEYIQTNAFGFCPLLTNVYLYNVALKTISPAVSKNTAATLASFDTTNDPTFHVVKGSTTEQTLRDAGYLTDENTVYIADTTALETAIAEAEAMDTSNYTDESVSAFTKAIENAKALLDNMDATQDEVDSAVKAIEDAKNALIDKSDEPSNPSDSSSNPSDSSNNPSDSSNPSGSDQPSNSGSSQPTSAQPATNAPTTAAPKVTPPTATKVVKPAKVKALRLKAKKKKLKVSWKKVSGATGYEVKAARNRKFTKGKKTVTVKKNKVTIKNLKPKKKYFVKVRAYKLANGRKYYGKWSKVVKKKVR